MIVTFRKVGEDVGNDEGKHNVEGPETVGSGPSAFLKPGSKNPDADDGGPVALASGIGAANLEIVQLPWFQLGYLDVLGFMKWPEY